MATFNDLIQSFQSRLDRSDCSDQLAAYFLGDAIQRAQRDLRLPSMERSRLILAQGPMSYVSIPSDLLEVIDIYASRAPQCPAKALERCAFRQISQFSTFVDPVAYARLNTTFQIRGAVPAGGSVEIIYYGRVSDFTGPTSTNELSLACPDVLVYGALKFAGDWCAHPSTDAWDATYQTLVQQVQAEVMGLENSGGPSTVQPLYRWE